jgi:mannosylglycoprotein endo-beta-mannosidase
MDQNSKRCWNVLTWNVRGINAAWKWDAVKNKIVPSCCDIFCLQETKREIFDSVFLRNICPSSFDNFEFIPSLGASGGILVAWKGSCFSGTRIFSNNFCVSIEFCSVHNNDSWVLTCVYAPCSPDGKLVFLEWLKNIQMPDNVDWLLLGDFNLIRKPEDRNRPGGSLSEMALFNEAISSLGINEVLLQGRKFTWSNMQTPPLMEKLDWVFTSNNRFFPTPAQSLRPWIWCPRTVILVLSLFPLSFQGAGS